MESDRAMTNKPIYHGYKTKYKAKHSALQLFFVCHMFIWQWCTVQLGSPSIKPF